MLILMTSNFSLFFMFFKAFSEWEKKIYWFLQPTLLPMINFSIGLALVILRVKRETGKSVDGKFRGSSFKWFFFTNNNQEIMDRLADPIDPKIESLLQEFGVQYYTYRVGNLPKTQLLGYMEIIKYFLSCRLSKFHDQLIQKFLYRIKHRKFSKPLQNHFNQCLEIIDTTSNNTHLVYFYHFLLACPLHQSIPYCISNISNLLDKHHHQFVNKTVQSIITSHNFVQLELNVHHKQKFLILFTSVLLHHKHSSTIFKALMIMCNDPFISRISMNSY